MEGVNQQYTKQLVRPDPKNFVVDQAIAAAELQMLKGDFDGFGTILDLMNSGNEKAFHWVTTQIISDNQNYVYHMTGHCFSAADKKLPAGLYCLGYIYEHGNARIRRNQTKALEKYKEAADLGFQPAVAAYERLSQSSLIQVLEKS